MTECSFCGEEFDSKRELHLHWGEEHEDELNSHKEEKVKKAERSAEEEEKQKKRKRRKMGFYGFSAVLGLAIVGLIIPQLISSGSSTTAAELDLEGQPMLGSENASVTVVEFGDYRCPYCARFEQATVSKLKDQYIDKGEVKFYFINFAFLGEGSHKAALAAECVYEQDKKQYWDYHQAIYDNQGPETEDWVTEDLLMDLAREHTEGLDYGELERCIENEETLQEVRSDRELARTNAVDSTPTVFVNGKKIQGNSFSAIKSVIEREIG
jgi:protein-disulfide isomerase